MKSDREWQLKEKTLARELPAVHLYHHVQRPAVSVAMQEFLKVKGRNKALQCGETNTCSSHSQQANILTIPCLVFTVVPSN